GVDRTFVVAVQLGPDVGGVECPHAVPRAVELQLHRLVGALGLEVADDLSAASLDVTILRSVDGNPALGFATDTPIAPNGQVLARVGDGPPNRGSVRIVHVVNRTT